VEDLKAHSSELELKAIGRNNNTSSNFKVSLKSYYKKNKALRSVANNITEAMKKYRHKTVVKIERRSH
jgi:hypothetical protein